MTMRFGPSMTNGGSPHHGQGERKKGTSKRTTGKGKKQPRKPKR
jgi:hypothetical protein